MLLIGIEKATGRNSARAATLPVGDCSTPNYYIHMVWNSSENCSEITHKVEKMSSVMPNVINISKRCPILKGMSFHLAVPNHKSNVGLYFPLQRLKFYSCAQFEMRKTLVCQLWLTVKLSL